MQSLRMTQKNTVLAMVMVLLEVSPPDSIGTENERLKSFSSSGHQEYQTLWEPFVLCSNFEN